MNGLNVDLHKLRAFVAIARHEHVGRAAKELHVSQSPLSRTLKALEDELGFALFTREKQRLKLNAAGRALAEDAAGLLAAASVVAARARAVASGEAGALAVGYVPGAVYSQALSRELSALRRDVPGVRVTLTAMRSLEQRQALLQRVVDVGYTHAPLEALVSTLVLDEPFVLAAPRGRGDAVSCLRSSPLIAPPESTSPLPLSELLLSCERIGARPSVSVEAQDPAVVLALVAGGLGVALIQQSLGAFAPPGVRILALPPRFGLRLRVYRCHRVAPPPLVARLLLSVGEGARA